MVAAMSVGLGAVLGTAIPTNVPLMSVGLDSIAAVEFASAVSGEVGVALSAVVLFDHPTLDSIASYLANEIGGEEGD
jgi:aryl carrier-like protein